MKSAESILSEHTDYSVEELTERRCEPILQPNDCLKAMHEFASQSRWIGCEDRLPEGNNVSCLWVDNEGDMYVSPTKYFQKIHISEQFTHWQELPKPPKQ